MPHDLAHLLSDHLLATFPPDRDYTLEVCEHPEMPDLVGHFLAQVLGRATTVELQTLTEARSAWFDYDAEALAVRWNAFLEELPRHMRIPASDWEDLLEMACGQVADYLVYPVASLVDFIFKEEGQTLEIDAVLRRMRYFKAYTYFEEVVVAYAERRPDTLLDRERFAGLLSHADRELSSEISAEGWLNQLEPMLNLFSRIPDLATRGYPIDVLITFFNEKGISGMVEPLTGMLRQRAYMDRPSLERLLMEGAPFGSGLGKPHPIYHPPTPRQAPPPDETPLEPWNDDEELPSDTEVNEIEDQETATEAAEERGLNPEEPSSEHEPVQKESAPRPAASPLQASPEPSSPVPLWRRFQKSAGKPVAAAADGPGATPLWMQYRKSSAGQGIDSLESAALGQPVERREETIRMVFSGSSSAYEQALQDLRRITSWEEASAYISREIFRKHEVDIYSEPALQLVELVEKRFKRS